MLHEALKLYVYPEAFVLEPLSASASLRGNKTSSTTLVFQRDTSQAVAGTTQDKYSGSAEKVTTCHGILGTIRLVSGYYLIVVTARQWVGSLDGHDIYAVTGTQVHRFARSVAHLSSRQKQDEEMLVQLVEAALRCNGYYFSYTYNLTQSLQREAHRSVEAQKPLWEQAMDRFYWNQYLQSSMVDLARTTPEIGRYVMPVIFGFLEVRHVQVNGASFDFALISRRNRYRMGTRYFSRGVDADGNVSNQVETEQIVVIHDTAGTGTRRRMSHVQTRGSIPVYWGQVCNLKYVPTLHIDRNAGALEAARKHFDDQKSMYGPQIIVNLVNKHGYEQPMANAFCDLMTELSNSDLRYIHFDFHRECSKMRWDRISLLLDDIAENLAQQGYFEQSISTDGSMEVLHQQSSAVRTNCMDCLDRTNVVQSAIARDVLVRQLRAAGVIGERQILQSFPRFEAIFRNIWADNADAISVAYSGTGALKTDFTRTGQRTKAGAMQDLSNSIVRYVKNNYLDGSRQDAYDLILGVYRVTPQSKLRLSADGPAVQRILPQVMLGALVMLLLSVIVSGPGIMSSFIYTLWCMIWIGLLAACAHMALQNAPLFVAWPRLITYPYISILPAARSGHHKRPAANTGGEQLIQMTTLSDKKFA